MPDQPRRPNIIIMGIAILVAALVPRLLGLDESFFERMAYGLFFGLLAIWIMNFLYDRISRG
ncbi:MAG: hypothetical protein KDD73_08845 [Anaerolineales bacterium]|nr:hypothetical protein [Anaerolineales bacterium]MCB9128050.1 hypothetical protein [Ardenticatenales bacterium]